MSQTPFSSSDQVVFDPPHLSYFKPDDFSRLYLERADEVAKAARAWRSRYPHANAPSIQRSSPKIAALGIDCQNAFTLPSASLYVPGAENDMMRAAQWIYRNTHQISKLFLSLDTHTMNQVFHPDFWENPHGRRPDPFTIITASQIREGEWRPRANQHTFFNLKVAMIDYCEQLERSGKYLLTIWPYHALLGGASHAVNAGLMEACMFHSVARSVDPEFVLKGRSQFTENYSIFSPEVLSLSDGVVGAGRGVGVGLINNDLVSLLKSYDRVYVFGEASSHCVMASLYDLINPLNDRNSHLDKIYILEDAMSPVPPPPMAPLPDALNFPMVAKQALADFADAGMHIVKTTDLIEV
jgi:nicotinamidase-related amidase